MHGPAMLKYLSVAIFTHLAIIHSSTCHGILAQPKHLFDIVIHHASLFGTVTSAKCSLVFPWRDIGQQRMFLVFRRQNQWDSNIRPFDSKSRVVEAHSTVGRGAIEIVALVTEQRVVLKDDKDMGKPAPEFEPEAMEELKHFQWTGNIRELRNIVERLVILCGSTVTKGDVARFGSPLH